MKELIALLADHAVARAAFGEAVRRRPGKVFYLAPEDESARGQPKVKLTRMFGLNQ